MRKNYKITLTAVASMDEETFKFYQENIADLHEALITQDEPASKLTIEETTEEKTCDW